MIKLGDVQIRVLRAMFAQPDKSWSTISLRNSVNGNVVVIEPHNLNNVLRRLTKAGLVERILAKKIPVRSVKSHKYRFKLTEEGRKVAAELSA